MYDRLGIVVIIALAAGCGGSEFVTTGDGSGGTAAGGAGATVAGGAGGMAGGAGGTAAAGAGHGGSAGAAGAGGHAGDVGPDAGSDDAGSDDSSVPEAGLDVDVPDVPIGCDTPVVFYPDADADGFGRDSAAVVACEPPLQGLWTTKPGDCNDDNPDVHPEQTQYFSLGYVTTSGGLSFDYDCSGSEQSDPSQYGGAPSCGGLSLGNCSGQGYVATSRTGPGLNALCGSLRMRKCQPDLLVCGAETFDISQAHRCR
jgi:hypothetical protein